MNSAIASLGKNLVLIGILALSTLNFFFGWLNWKELLAVQSMVALVYVFLSCYEFLNASYKASLPVKRFAYFSNRYLMFKILKIGIFVGCSVLLYASGSRVQYLYPVCLMIAATEAVITFLKYRRSLCFVNIYANYLLLAEDKFEKVFAAETMLVEFRHEIFYFVKKNRKTVIIKLEHIADKEEFVQAINTWINRNAVLVSAESKIKINELIASV